VARDDADRECEPAKIAIGFFDPAATNIAVASSLRQRVNGGASGANKSPQRNF
jgi:hypothetical protein